MSLTNSLNNALSGLTATSRMAEIVSSNLSNALTDGYGRRSVDLSSSQVGGRGAGVQIDGITRIMDRGVLADRRLADASIGGHQRGADMLHQLENLLGLVDDASGLSGRLAALEQALISAGSDPASEQRLGLVLSRLGEVTGAIQSNASVIAGMRQEADADIASDVETLNVALQQVEKLNADIGRARATGNDTSALMDSRQVVVDKIAVIVPVREIERENGRVALMTTSGQMLIDGRAAKFDFTSTRTITADMSIASGGLSGVLLNGIPLNADDGFGRLDGGSLSASFALRDQTLVDAQQGLDQVAADLIARFSDPSVDPTLTGGDPGLLTDAGGSVNPLDIVGLSGRIAIHTSADPTQGGVLSRLRDGVNAIGTGPIGNAAQINRWLSALDAPLSLTSGAPAQSAASNIASFTSNVGTTRLQAEEQLSFSTARWDTLRQAELSNGVDSDYELQMLMRIEQAYAANAKVMQTVDFMMQRLMEI